MMSVDCMFALIELCVPQPMGRYFTMLVCSGCMYTILYYSHSIHLFLGAVSQYFGTKLPKPSQN